MNVFAGHRRLILEGADDAPAVVDLDLLVTGLAVQQLFVILLDAELADVAGCRVVGQLALFVEFLQIGGIDACHIAQGVGEGLAVRVEAFEIGLNAGARVLVLIEREGRHLLLGELIGQGDRIETAVTWYFLEKILFRLGVEFEQQDQLVEHLGEIVDLFGDDLEAEHGTVFRQQHPVAIEDQSARRRDRHHLDAVVVGASLVVIVMDHLHHIQVQQQHQGQDDDAGHGDHGATAEQGRLGVVILDGDAFVQHGSLSVVGVIGGDAPGPVQALGHHHPHQWMGQRQGGERPALFGQRLALRGQPLGAADQQGDIAAIELPNFQLLRQLLRGPGLAGNIQRHDAGVLAGGGQGQLPLLVQDAGDVGVLAPFARRDLHQLQRHILGKTPLVFIESGRDPIRHLGADGDQLDLHAQAAASLKEPLHSFSN